jgi:hypothetical protein
MTAVRCAIPGQDVLGETPLWCDRTQSLLWLDIDAGKLQRFHPASGRHDVVNFDARHAGSLAVTHDPSRVLLGLDLGLHFFDLGTGEQALLAQVEPAERDNRLNAGRCDAQGRFWVGTMDNALHRRVLPRGCVRRSAAAVRRRDRFQQRWRSLRHRTPCTFRTRDASPPGSLRWTRRPGNWASAGSSSTTAPHAGDPMAPASIVWASCGTRSSRPGASFAKRGPVKSIASSRCP